MTKSPAPFDQGLFLMHLHKGKEYFDQNQLQKAKTELESAFKLRPQDDKVLNLLGMTYFKLELLPEAEEMYAALASNNPDIYTLQSNLGLIRFKLEKFSDAENSLQRALELQPMNPKAHFYLGLLYEKMSNWEKALNHFQQAKAEKMISKIQEKMAQDQKMPGALLHFEVLEVLDEQEQEIEHAEEAAPLMDRNPFAPEDEKTMLLQKESLRNQGGWIERDFTSTIRRVEDEIFSPAPAPEAEVAEPGVDSEDGTMFLSREEFQNSSSEASVVPENASIEDIQEEELHAEESSAGLGEGERASLQREWVEDGYGTGKMRRRDVMEVMDRLEEQEPEVEELLEDLSSVPGVEDEGALDSSKEFAIILKEASDAPASGVVPESEASQIQSPAEEIPSWEKTDPTIVHFEPEPEPQPTSDTMQTPRNPLKEGAFLIDDEQTAADISSFLAQSRTGDEVVAPKTNEFEEPPTVLTTRTELEENPTPAEESLPTPEPAEFVEDRIPTPEEVENERLVTEEDSTPLGEPPVAEDKADQRDLIEEWHLQSAPEPRHAGDSTQMMSAVDAPALEFPPANLDQFSRDRFYVQPLIGADRFLLIDPHLLEIIISERLICRRGSISSYTGNLHFLPWLTQYEKTIPLIQVDGSGIVFLADKRKEIFMLSLNNETIFVESNHLLVAQSALKVEPYMMEESGTGTSLSVVKISGRGSLAVTCMTKPLTLNVYQAMPVNIPGDGLIVWSGNLKSDFVHDEELRNIMMFSDEEEEVMLLRFSGNGDVVVEQGSLWGDRRAKK
jgi:tetratricopeptide (TPR) repeat protein